MTHHATSKLVTAADAFADVVSGSTVAIGGVLGRRRPLALCRALAATDARSLHVMSFLAGRDTEILAAAGSVSQLTTGYIDPRSLPEATEAGITNGTIRLNEMSEHLFVGSLLAASSGLPCWLTLGAAGSDVAAALDVREVTCPYTGRPLLAIEAASVDLAIIHAPAATAAGVVLGPNQREFLDDADLTIARAARRVVVSTDRLITDDEAIGAGRAVLAAFEIAAVVHTPDGGDR